LIARGFEQGELVAVRIGFSVGGLLGDLQIEGSRGRAIAPFHHLQGGMLVGFAFFGREVVEMNEAGGLGGEERNPGFETGFEQQAGKFGGSLDRGHATCKARDGG
jgi:hypothetical protein